MGKTNKLKNIMETEAIEFQDIKIDYSIKAVIGKGSFAEVRKGKHR